jgi:RNA polymerase sigma-70 factor (ECF subfamily)
LSDTDTQLLTRLLQGDPRAFDACFAEYYPKVYRFALRRVGGDIDLAEDVAQATLCRAFESLPTFRGEASLFTWLCTICRREISRRGSRGADSVIAVSEDDPEVRAALESLGVFDPGDPALRASAQELREAVLVALDYVAPVYANILEWKYVRDLSVATIAQRLGRSEKATESMLTRARAAFREAFTILHGDALRRLNV